MLCHLIIKPPSHLTITTEFINNLNATHRFPLSKSLFSRQSLAYSSNTELRYRFLVSNLIHFCEIEVNLLLFSMYQEEEVRPPGHERLILIVKKRLTGSSTDSDEINESQITIVKKEQSIPAVVFKQEPEIVSHQHFRRKKTNFETHTQSCAYLMI